MIFNSITIDIFVALSETAMLKYEANVVNKDSLLHYLSLCNIYAPDIAE